MKIGVRHRTLDNPPVRGDAVNVFVAEHGIRVLIDPAATGVAEAEGFWPDKRIVVGVRFLRMNFNCQMATLLHEAWHCKALHKEAKLLAMIALSPLMLCPTLFLRVMRKVFAWTEFAADAYAARRGHGLAMIEVVMSGREATGVLDFHPSNESRVANIQRVMKGVNYVAPVL